MGIRTYTALPRTDVSVRLCEFMFTLDLPHSESCHMAAGPRGSWTGPVPGAGGLLKAPAQEVRPPGTLLPIYGERRLLPPKNRRETDIK